MNKLIIVSLVILLAVVSACSIDEIETFSSEAYVYFPIENERLENIDDFGYLEKNYTFIFESEQAVSEKLYELPVKIAGAAIDKDRKIAFAVVDSLSSAKEGVHYELVSETESIIPAGVVDGTIKVMLLKTAEMDETMFDLAIKIIDSDDLKAGPQDAIIIKYSNFLLKPNWWNTWTLGEFTIAKCVLWLNFMGVDDGSDPWAVEPYIIWKKNNAGDDIPWANETARKQSVQMFVLWLEEGDENGDPYIDENGMDVVDTI
ncbi:DUF4843 domain-containing protein [Carboxylicivirga sp. RSCT41]|uniref:DUF4843 domain-containing protein n=1 Tax=Carboxylicivirga agarovorans TaxID=3417570 RepID=UPI003D350281